MMDRRTFNGAVATVLGMASLAAEAPPGRQPRIGFLGNENPTSNSRQLEAFRRGLHDLGWVEGRTVMIS